MTLVENLKWRYATKKMNGKQVPEEKLDYILEAARYAPSSSGLQPYKILVVSDPEKLEQIKEIAFNQSQITDGSHLLVWAAWNDYSYEKIDDVMLATSRERGLPDNATEEYKKRLWSMYEPKGEAWRHNHAARQAYISFALAIAAAAEQKVDATPMEGFDNKALDELLGLEAMGLKSVVIMPIGYRDESADWLAGLKKVRTAKEDFVLRIA